MECVPLIDISSEDDLLIPSSSQGLGSETFSNLEAENTEWVSKQMEQVSELSESPQQKRIRSDRYSLRKSLAWDSEFFTSEGVLNPEELAIINSTSCKATLPRIHEEFRKSAESTSTLDSESQALENLEVRLFENLRASIQRSLVDSNQIANMEHSGKTKEQRKPDIPHLRTLKKLDISSQTKLKSPSTLKKHGTIRQHQESTYNDGFVDAKLVASGNGQARTTNKPPEISSTIPLRTVHGKRSSSVENKQIKSNRGKVLPGITTKGQAGLALKKAINDTGMASSSIPSKEYSFGTPQAGFKLVAASCCSSSRPASSSSDSSSPSLAIIRNATRNSIRSSSSLSSKTPAKTTRSRTGSRNEICSSSLGKSTLQLSKVSPTSSIDSFPSESSSQTCTSTKHSNSLKGSNGGLSSSPSIVVSTENGASLKSGALPQSFTGNHSKIILNFDSDTKGATSLGLRMPRPRIGYFDKEKAIVHGSNKYLLTSLRSSLVKSTGTTETAAANKCKHSNLPSLSAGAHPYALNQTSKSAEAQLVLKTIDKHKKVSPEVKKESSPKTAKGYCKRTFKEAGAAPVRVECKFPCNLRKKEHPNLLQTKYVVTANETHANAEQRVTDQAHLMNIQQEQVQSELNDVTSIEKENLYPASNTECQSKALRTEDQYNTVTMLEEMVSSLSLSEIKDVTTS